MKTHCHLWNAIFGSQSIRHHDTQRIQGLGNYKIHSVILVNNPMQRRRHRGMTCLIKGELEKYVSIIKMMNINATCGLK